MSNLLLLLNTNIINEFKLNNIKNADKREKNKILGTTILILFSIGILAYYIFEMCISISDILIQINQMELLLVIGFLGSTLFTLFTSIYKAPSYLFNAKDFDTLTSLPIKDSTVLSSKILMLLFTNYLYSLGVMLIPAIVYFIKVDISAIYFIYLVLLMLMMPLIPIVISSIISFFIGGISSKFKYKNAVLIIGSILLLIAYMSAMTQIESIGMNILKNSKGIIDGISRIYPPTYYFIDALKNSNLISLLIFSLISLVPFLLFIKIFSKIFKSINAKMNESYKDKDYEVKELKYSSPTIALMKKEISRYFSSYIYVLNTSVGIILLTLMTTGVLVFGADKINMMLNLNIDMNMIKPQIIVAILFIIIMSCTTYCSISFEGKNLWILKSSPIKETDIFKAKVYMNLLLNIPIPIICFLLLGFKLKFGLGFIAIMTLTIIAMSILVSLSGLFANLHFPNLDWKNEVAVVKRSIGIIIVIFGGMIYLGIYAGVYFILNISNLNIYLLIGTIITLVLDYILYNIIKTKGVKLFKAI